LDLLGGLSITGELASALAIILYIEIRVARTIKREAWLLERTAMLAAGATLAGTLAKTEEAEEDLPG
jgi:hypothetical protein